MVFASAILDQRRKIALWKRIQCIRVVRILSIHFPASAVLVKDLLL